MQSHFLLAAMQGFVRASRTKTIFQGIVHSPSMSRDRFYWACFLSVLVFWFGGPVSKYPPEEETDKPESETKKPDFQHKALISEVLVNQFRNF